MKSIRKLRLSAKLTQDEFAQKLDVSASAIKKWETNKAVPSLKSLRKLEEFEECQQINKKRKNKND